MPSHRGFLTPARLILYAAALVVIAGLVFYFTQQKQNMGLPQPIPPAQVANFLEQEHRAAAGAADPASRFEIREFSQVPDVTRNWVGRSITLEGAAAAGLEFVGGSRSQVPGLGASAHFLFRNPSGEGGAEPVSVFVQIFRPDGSELPVEAGQAYWMDPDAGAPRIVVWRQSGLLYFLVAPSEATREAVRQAMGVPAPGGTL